MPKDYCHKVFNEKMPFDLNKKTVLVIVPAFNEEESIQNVLQELAMLTFKVSVLVVDDGSVDRTSDRGREQGISVITLPFNLGIGGAMQTGYKFAKDYGYDIAVQVDGDGQHDVKYLKDLLEPVIHDEVDMSIGSRFIPPRLGYQSSLIRRVGIIFFARLISMLTGYKVTDPTSGFRAVNKNLIDIFVSYYPSDYPEPEAIVVAKRYGCRIREIPVEMRPRCAGNSSIRYLKTCYYMIKVTLAVFVEKLK